MQKEPTCMSRALPRAFQPRHPCREPTVPSKTHSTSPAHVATGSASPAEENHSDRWAPLPHTGTAAVWPSRLCCPMAPWPRPSCLHAGSFPSAGLRPLLPCPTSRSPESLAPGTSPATTHGAPPLG